MRLFILILIIANISLGFFAGYIFAIDNNPRCLDVGDFFKESTSFFNNGSIYQNYTIYGRRFWCNFDAIAITDTELIELNDVSTRDSE